MFFVEGLEGAGWILPYILLKKLSTILRNNSELVNRTSSLAGSTFAS